MPRETLLADLLSKYDKIAICGGPATGKSYLSRPVTDRPVIHTDDYKGKDWADTPTKTMAALDGMPRFLVEGVHASHCLRRGLKVDAVIFLDDIKDVSRERPATTKAVNTVFNDWRAHNRTTPVHSPDR